MLEPARPVVVTKTKISGGIIGFMLHRHLDHSDWTLAAVDDVIARGQLEDWKELRDAAVERKEIRDRILRVCAARLTDPYEQRYQFWHLYVRRHFA